MDIQRIRYPTSLDICHSKIIDFITSFLVLKGLRIQPVMEWTWSDSHYLYNTDLKISTAVHNDVGFCSNERMAT